MSLPRNVRLLQLQLRSIFDGCNPFFLRHKAG